jgi:S1-C subfamily serine protease
MSALDWVIVAFTAVFALLGYRQGLIVGALSLIGFVFGAYLGIRFAPLILSGGTQSTYAPLLEMIGGVAGGALVATALERVARGLRRSLVLPGLGLADGVLGGVFGALLALGVAWVVASAAVHLPTSRSIRATVEQSLILHHLDEVLPSSGGVLSVLARLDPLPSISGPEASVPPPSGRIAGSAAIQRDLQSVVRIVGTACGVGIEGSGWVAAPQTVVTNAHVVAGEQDPTVQVPGDTFGLQANVVEFDPHDDIAVLHVPDLELAPIAIAQTSPSGTEGEVAGYPEGGPLAVDAARIGTTQEVQTDNAYGEGPVERSVTPVRGLIRSGNSGGPVLDGEGQVLTMVFAKALGGGAPSGYGVADGSIRAALTRALEGHGISGSGRCVNG